MRFSVNETIFEGEVDISNESVIQSYNKKYLVTYNNKTLREIINEEYEVNDFIVIDRNVLNLDADCLNQINNKNVFVLDATEETKTIFTVLQIVDQLLENKFNKKNKMLVIGGGITQDVGGMAASIYKRGLKWTLVPTTVLSMTDSCIGGKVGVNHKSKNMLAMFYAPDKVIVSDYFIPSLSPEDIMSGIGEALKLSLIGGEETYQMFLDDFKLRNYINLIKMSTSVKKLIIEKDELERNERKVLNLGHTIGHAIESASDYFIPHGIAVMYGMYIKNKLFYGDKFKEVNQLILDNIPSKFLKAKVNYNLFIESMLNDKKNDGDKICFVLFDEIGQSIFVFKTLREVDSDLRKIFINLFV